MHSVRALALAFALTGTACGSAWAQDTPQPTPQPPPPSEAPAFTGPEITLQTTMGDIVITLDPVGAPKTAAQFLGLVKTGHYNGAAVYRIEPGFVIQLGDLDAKLAYRAPKLPPIPSKPPPTPTSAAQSH